MIALGLPPEASTIAPRVDLLLYVVTAVTGLVAIAIFVTMIVFGIRYRAGSRAPRANDIPALQARARRRVETAWTLIPIALFIGTIGAVSVFKAVYIDRRELKCACVGGSSNVPLGFVSLTENLMMIGMALWMLSIGAAI